MTFDPKNITDVEAEEINPKPTAETNSTKSTKPPKEDNFDFDNWSEKEYKKKKEAIPKADIEIEDQENEKEIAEEIEALSKDEVKTKINAADCYIAGKFILKTFNAFFVSGCKWWSGEENGKQFAVPQSEIQELSKLLGGLLFRWQVNVGPGIAFALMFLMAFGAKAMDANEKRNENKSKDKKEPKKQLKKEKPQQTYTVIQKKIIDQLKQKNQTVKQLLSKMKDVTDATLRRELKELSDLKIIIEDKSDVPFMYRMVEKKKTEPEPEKSND